MGFGKKRGARRRSRPGIEALEGRAVPATFHAANVAQLQADLAAVSNTSGPNTIDLAPGTYDLTGELQVQNAGDLTIQGNPKDPAAISLVGGYPFRVLEIDGGHVTISGVTISGGGDVEQGGGIEAQDADLTVEKSTITGNWAMQMGGGIFAQGGTLDVEDSSVSGNSAQGGADCLGGGIAASGAQVTVANSTIMNNYAFNGDVGSQAAFDTGGGIYAQHGTLVIAGSKIKGNTAFSTTSGTSATSLGGGVSTSDTIVSIARSAVTNNNLESIANPPGTSQGSAFSTIGGSLTITDCTFSGNGPEGKGEFYHPGVTVVLKGSTVDGRKLLGEVTLDDNGSTSGR